MPKHFYKGLELEIKGRVYEPREDSELLAEVVESEIARRALENGVISFLDLGCGSGIIATVAAKAGAVVSAVDIDEEAVELTKRNAKLNEAAVDCRLSDLFSNVDGKFDVIAFNAPYLPEEIVKGENTVWAAGQRLEVIQRAIEQAVEHMKPGGALLLAVSSLTGLQEAGRLLEDSGFKWQKVAEKKVPWETLYVLRAVL
jgi:release factor glutamine methyltransferase